MRISDGSVVQLHDGERSARPILLKRDAAILDDIVSPKEADRIRNHL